MAPPRIRTLGWGNSFESRTARAPRSRLFLPKILGLWFINYLMVFGIVFANYRVTLAEAAMFEQLLLIGALLFLYVFVITTAQLMTWIVRRLVRTRDERK
jgi:hypothetical protein